MTGISENKLFIGQGYHALYRNVAALAMAGTGVHNGCSPSPSGSRALGVNIDGGVVSRGGSIDTPDPAEVVVAGADEFPRRDVIYWDGNGFAIEEGQPDPVPDEIENASRFEQYQPSPPSIDSENWVVICEVHIAPDTAEITSSDINDLRTSPSIHGNLPDDSKLYFGDDGQFSLRRDPDSGDWVIRNEDTGQETMFDGQGATFPGEVEADTFTLEAIRSLTQLSFPEYASTADAPQEPGVIYVPPDGTDTEGYYKYDPADDVYKLFDEADGQVSSGDLSDLNIDTAKNWGGHELTGLGGVGGENGTLPVTTETNHNGNDISNVGTLGVDKGSRNITSTEADYIVHGDYNTAETVRKNDGNVLVDTDPVSALEAAINDGGVGTTVYLTGEHYYDSPVTIQTDDIEIGGDGSITRAADFKGWVIHFEGGDPLTETSADVTADGEIGDIRVSVSDTSLFNVDDYVTVFELDGTRDYRVVNRVFDVHDTDGEIELHTPIKWGLSANESYVSPHPMVEGATLEGLSFFDEDEQTPDQRENGMVFMESAANIRLRDVYAEDIKGDSAFRLKWSRNALIEQADINRVDAFDLGYGISLTDSTNISVIGLHASYTRHAVTTNYAYDINHVNSVSNHSHSSGFDTHAYTKDVTYSNCISEGCEGGITVRGQRITISNYIANGISDRGLRIRESVKDVSMNNVQINNITGHTGNVTVYHLWLADGVEQAKMSNMTFTQNVADSPVGRFVRLGDGEGGDPIDGLTMTDVTFQSDIPESDEQMLHSIESFIGVRNAIFRDIQVDGRQSGSTIVMNQSGTENVRAYNVEPHESGSGFNVSSGVRMVENDVGETDTDPRDGGQWNGYGYEGLKVLGPNYTYEYTGGEWSASTVGSTEKFEVENGVAVLDIPSTRMVEITINEINPSIDAPIAVQFSTDGGGTWLDTADYDYTVEQFGAAGTDRSTSNSGINRIILGEWASNSSRGHAPLIINCSDFHTTRYPYMDWHGAATAGFEPNRVYGAGSFEGGESVNAIRIFADDGGNVADLNRFVATVKPL